MNATVLSKSSNFVAKESNLDRYGCPHKIIFNSVRQSLNRIAAYSSGSFFI